MLFGNVKTNTRTLVQQGIFCPKITIENIFLFFDRNPNTTINDLY